MASVKIDGLDKAIEEVLKDYKSAIRNAAEEATKKAKNDIYSNALSCLVAYYNDYPDPTSYDRTYTLVDSFVPFQNIIEGKDGILCSAGVIFDSSRVSYFRSWSYSDFDSNGMRQPADSEWIISNFLAGIHPRTDGSREPGGGNYEYEAYYGSFVPAEEMQRYINRYYYTFERNFNRAIAKQILRKVRR